MDRTAQINVGAAGGATYPDAAVVCDPVECDADSSTHVTNPRVIFEVLSPTTERYDQEQKRLYLQQLDSLCEYVLVAQDRRRVGVAAGVRLGLEYTVHDAGSRAPLRSIGASSTSTSCTMRPASPERSHQPSACKPTWNTNSAATYAITVMLTSMNAGT